MTTTQDVETVRVKHLRPFDVTIYLTDGGEIDVVADAEVDVPPEVANGSPATRLNESGERVPATAKLAGGSLDPNVDGFHPGYGGLLDQPDAWQLVKPPKRATNPPGTSPADVDPEV